jgi:phosphoribosylformylglycinamidine cyclo-ligase
VRHRADLVRALVGPQQFEDRLHIQRGRRHQGIDQLDPANLDIEASAIVLPPVFDWLQREGAVPQTEMWRTFNCGVGFVLVVASGDVAMVESDLAHLGLAHRRIGAVVRADDDGERVRIG